ncbi:mannitol dehydrogenase family protein [Lichenihabitans sp. Uapishka_5]|uniref:mannitol dehydrogenase family protein n=1 Tax=Lichenihabitans sp. Uapishka_5 TaxID=3037302 RepID=UPI0029E7EC60|nr:mannitol dehydrogenase family protein [Lichenihabitans sp. Uapishka_5]MDX7950013.1 mannitol dehydrogenase family protein [Lichenihabitans sp. Uapishka_5]
MNDHPRLCTATLDRLPHGVARPSYDRATLATGIVHLGIGAFHRAHQAVYTDSVLAMGDRRWGILGASLRSADTCDALAPQDGLYGLAVRDAAGERLQVVGSVTRLAVAPEDPDALIAAMAAPDTHIVSLTVTEKGYCHRPATGALDEDHPDVRHDLAHPEAPRSAPGFIVEALRRRRAAGLTPFTALCCDNLPHNGATLRRVLVRFAALRDPDLGRYVEGELRCPSTMVDRIVPATTDADRARVADALGLADAWPIMTEPFTQWVIEDDFAGPRPAWDAAGATFVQDVAPYELAKLRLLNGSHSTLAYLGYLAGHETVSDTMAAPGFAALVEALMRDEAAPTLPPVPGLDVSDYAASLLARFRNPALQHRTWQIAMDGSQKLPQRLLGTVRDRLVAGQPFGRLALGIAAWMRYVTGRDERGEAIDVRDPLAADLRARTAPCTTAEALIDACLGVQAVFGTDLPAEPAFRSAVGVALAALLQHGAAKVVAEFQHPA